MVLANNFLKNSFLAKGFRKVVDLGFYFNEGKVTVTAKKRYFQE